MVTLDTDLMTLLGWSGSDVSIKLRARLSELPPNNLSTTIITFEEYVRGWLTVLAQSKKIKEQIQAYKRLSRQLQHFCRFTMLDFDERAAIEFQRLKKTHRRVGTMDLKIAAIAISQGALLLSRNLQDFQQIPGLRVEDWTKE